MGHLVLPNQIKIKLIVKDVYAGNIWLYIKIFEKKDDASNGFDEYLGPFISDENGLIIINKIDLEKSFQEIYRDKSILRSFENFFSYVELGFYTQKKIELISSWKREIKEIEKNKFEETAESQYKTKLNKLALKSCRNKLLYFYDTYKTDLDGQKNVLIFEFPIFVFPSQFQKLRHKLDSWWFIFGPVIIIVIIKLIREIIKN